MTERFPPLAPDAMNAAQKTVAEAILNGPRGQIQGPFNILLRAPQLADHVQRLGAHLRVSSALDGRLREVARPGPSHHSTFTRSPRRARNTNSCLLNGS